MAEISIHYVERNWNPGPPVRAHHRDNVHLAARHQVVKDRDIRHIVRILSRITVQDHINWTWNIVTELDRRKAGRGQSRDVCEARIRSNGRAAHGSRPNSIAERVKFDRVGISGQENIAKWIESNITKEIIFLAERGVPRRPYGFAGRIIFKNQIIRFAIRILYGASG